jgi:hypothetical protein
VSRPGAATAPPRPARAPADAADTQQIPVVSGRGMPPDPRAEETRTWRAADESDQTPPGGLSTLPTSSDTDPAPGEAGGSGNGNGRVERPRMSGDGLSATVAPADDGGYQGVARRSVRRTGGSLGRSYWRELLVILVLVTGAMSRSWTLLVIGYVFALSSKVWPLADKRFAVIAVPMITVVLFGALVGLRATGHLGNERPGARELAEETAAYLVTLPLALGLFTALFLAWRLSRSARAARVSDAP